MTTGAYLDYNATAPIRPAVAEAMSRALAETGNASSVHGYGRAQRARIEDARDAVARLVGAPPAGLVFTASGSEANNLALRGAGRRRLLVSAGEHDSVLRARSDAETIPIGGDGRVRLDALEALLLASDEPALVSVMLANNETGVIQPVAEVATLAHAAGALLHCDAVQAAGRLAVDMAALGIDMLTLSAHKLAGPQGVGALALAPGLEIEALVRGGGQERRRRAGTENVAGIVGFGVAAEAALGGLKEAAALAGLRDELEARAGALVPELVIAGAGAPRLPNTSCLAVPGCAAETLVIALDLAGVAVSAGSACSSGKVESSHVLRAMGLPEAVAGGAIRVSLGWASRPEDIALFLRAWAAHTERVLERGAPAARESGRTADPLAL